MTVDVVSPPMYVQVEFLGEASPLDDLGIAFRLATGQCLPEEENLWRAAAESRLARVDWVSKRIVCPDGWRDENGTVHPGFPGLSRPYVFGPSPQSYVQTMTYADAQILFASTSAHQFRDTRDPNQDLILPPTDWRLVSEVEGDLRSVYPREVR